MGISERKKREKEQRRATIIEAAEELIKEKGLEAVTMDEIAEKAELSKGALYLYFKNKSDLYLAVNAKGMSLLNERLSEVLAEPRTGLELVYRFWEVTREFVKEDPDYFEAFKYFETWAYKENALSAKERLNECEELSLRIFVYLRRALQIGVQDGSINPKYSPKLLAVILWSELRGLLQIYSSGVSGQGGIILEDMDIEPEEVIQKFMELISAELSGKEESV